MNPRTWCLTSTEVARAPEADPQSREPAPAAASSPARCADLHLHRHGHRHVRPCRSARETPTTWPLGSDGWCWWCCHPFAGQPHPLPIAWDERRDLFTVCGNFCSWSCVKAYNMHSSSCYKGVRSNLIAVLRKKACGRLAPVKCAPPRQALRVFGGQLSIEEFRRMAEGEAVMQLLPEKMVVAPTAMEVVRPVKRKQPEARDLDFTSVQQVNETLRLRRPKPLGGSNGGIEKTFGFTMFADAKHALAP